MRSDFLAKGRSYFRKSLDFLTEITMLKSQTSSEPVLHSRMEQPDCYRTWNATGSDYPRWKTVAQLFEEVATAHPNSAAVIFEDRQLTYRELNARANRLAHRLRSMGVGPETMVGCCMERSIELIVALVAILKTGGAYVPVDPAYPEERFDLILQDTKTPVILTQSRIASTLLSDLDVPAICVDTATDGFDSGDTNPSSVGEPTSLAYVMYTSGSTGRPKGVMVENRSIVRLVRNTNFCNFGPHQVFLQFAPISFDASTLEIWGPLLNGGRLVLMSPSHRSLEELGRVVREQGVTTLWLTAGLFHLMIDQRIEDLRSVHQLLAGGDVLSARHVRKALANLPGCTLINGYGPTENTTFTCCHIMHFGETVPDSVPIGRPIANTQIYVLDEFGQPVLPGQVGELHAGGDGVARGYLNDPEGTAARFLPNPFAAEKDGRMYRTGDLVRWREDGIVEFLGRVDSQVKILGHRIEPGELETVLGTHPSINQVCVVAHAEGGDSRRLIAYYVPREVAGISAGELREFLLGKVPHYMIPALFVRLAFLPLSPNGKVDRTAMPVPVFTAEQEVPQTQMTDLEETIAEVWKRILPLSSVALDHNFFDVGGDSLLLLAVHSNLQRILEIQIPLSDLFEFTTVRSLAKHLKETKPAGPSFSDLRQLGQKQRDAFARQRDRQRGL
jgi:amino acid adenylation domain-containing protein